MTNTVSQTPVVLGVLKDHLKLLMKISVFDTATPIQSF